jgi:hypothetical protein
MSSELDSFAKDCLKKVTLWNMGFSSFGRDGS